MPLCATHRIMHHAMSFGRGVGAFNVVHLEHAEAHVAGAARAGVPVILQISENTASYHGGLQAVGLAALAVARGANVPVAVHLDHARSHELINEALALGFQSVMFDGSELSYDENVAATREVTARCHAREVWVEAELGEIGGKDGVHAPGARTDPAEAAQFVSLTGIDALAVAVGTSHAMTTRDAAIDLNLIERLRARLPVPLVLHGSSGVSEGDLRAAVRAGMVKINIATRLNAAHTAALRKHLNDHPDDVDPRAYTAPARAAVAAEVEHLLNVLNTTGTSAAPSPHPN